MSVQIVTEDGLQYTPTLDGEAAHTINSFEYSPDGIVVNMTEIDYFEPKEVWKFTHFIIKSNDLSDIVNIFTKMDIDFFKTPEKLFEAAFYFIRTYAKNVSVVGYHIERILIEYILDEDDPSDDAVDMTITLWKDGATRSEENKLIVTCGGIYESALTRLIYMTV